MIEDPQLEQIFRAEAEERLGRLDGGFLALERGAADPELLEDMFREMHSLKGAARMLGLAAVEATSHDLETLLNGARRGQSHLAADGIEALDAGLRKLRAQIAEALAHGPAPTAPAPPREAPPAFRIETVRVETGKLDELLTLAGELGILQGRSQYRQGLIAQLQEEWSRLEACRRDLGFARPAPAALQEKEEALVARLGRLLRSARDAAQEDGARLETSLAALQDQVQSMRLLPLATVFGLFPRMVRDLAREQGKEAELHLEGSDITLDKRILEEIKDPLMHLLRNAVGHGIEAPAERQARGKPRTGSIRLAARRNGDHVLVSIEDDGRGLDLEAIRRTALQAGLHDADSLNGFSPAQLHQLVFAPGFSTMSTVTELAGRGVGLDVVQANVERLKGSIRLDSTPGAGTSLALRLPLSLTTLHLLVVQADRLPFGLAMESVRTMGRQPVDGFYRLDERTAMDLDGRPVLAPPLAALLGLGGREGTADEGGRIPYVVLEVENELLALQVENLLGEEEVVPRPLGAPLRRVRHVASLATLANGDICPVLRPADLLHAAQSLATLPAAPPRPAPAAEPRARAAILLVEDSALVRAMEKRIIEDAGYEVVTAVDGLDALGKLEDRGFAGVVSDIQMPNLDGLGLTARLRQDPRFRDLPVVLVSSLESESDRRRGLAVGATAYLAKPAFDQRELLEILARVVAP